GIPFTILKPDIDETQHPGEAPLDYVRRLSREKSEAVANQLQHSIPHDQGLLPLSTQWGGGRGEGIILAADTIVVLGADTVGVDDQGAVLGKPVDADDAREMLRRLRGRTHQVITAMTLHVLSPSPFTGRGSGGGVLTRLTTTNVTMRDYSDAEIE